MNVNEFITAYQALSSKRFVYYAIQSFFTGLAIIVIGAVTNITFLIPFGFIFFFVFFGFIIVAAIKSSKNAPKKRQLIFEKAWRPLVASTKSLSDLELMDDEALKNVTLKGRLIDELSSKSTARDVQYAFRMNEDLLYYIYYYHVVSTGKGSSNSVDFKGFYYQANTQLEGTLLIKKDLPKLIRNIKHKIQNETDNDGSEKYKIEGSLQPFALEIIDRFEGLGFNTIALSVKNGVLEVALDQFYPFPKVTKNASETMKNHQDYLLKSKQILEAINQTKQSLMSVNNS